MTAGLSRRISPTTFLAAKAAFADRLGILGLLVGASISFLVADLRRLMAFGGFAFPGIFVSMKARGRRDPNPRSCPTRSTSSRSASRPASASTGRSQAHRPHWTARSRRSSHSPSARMRIGEEPPRRAEEAAAARGHARGGLVRASGHPGRPARHLARAHPQGAVRGLAQPPADGGRGEGDEGADQDALPTVAFIFPAMFLVVLRPVLSLKEILRCPTRRDGEGLRHRPAASAAEASGRRSRGAGSASRSRPRRCSPRPSARSSRAPSRTGPAPTSR